VKYILFILLIGITLFAFYIVAFLAVVPYLWFKDYLYMEKTREKERKEMFSEEFLNRGKLKSRFPRLHTTFEQVFLFVFTWLPFLTIEILWIRQVWRIVMDVIMPRIADLIPL